MGLEHIHYTPRAMDWKEKKTIQENRVARTYMKIKLQRIPPCSFSRAATVYPLNKDKLEPTTFRKFNQRLTNCANMLFTLISISVYLIMQSSSLHMTWTITGVFIEGVLKKIGWRNKDDLYLQSWMEELESRLPFY